MTLSADNALAILPDTITYEQAAASLEGAHYAYNFINKVKLTRGQKALVNGATGAIGSSLVQLLHYSGVEVTAVCGTQNIDLIKSLGAHRVIDYTANDFTKDNQQYHFIFDAVGKSSFGKCKPLLLPGGTYISSELGPNWENIYLPLVTAVIGNKKVIFPVPLNIKRSIMFIKKLFEQGHFKAVIDRKYPLEKIAEAYQYVVSGQKIGNVVITLEDTHVL
jgi:NADPH:quinone reductase-like Zn-dependent oxidoreductase